MTPQSHVRPPKGWERPFEELRNGTCPSSAGSHSREATAGTGLHLSGNTIETGVNTAGAGEPPEKESVEQPELHGTRPPLFRRQHVILVG